MKGNEDSTPRAELQLHVISKTTDMQLPGALSSIWLEVFFFFF